ncbi:hypothetical protein AAT19DRAFT_10544 [Rhodotorula toruloides]|uniref:Uncharacterized protein n=1 Tax=Rhodotorula toruloides TaxID=5286 RepID=A0A2S9ZZ35_RHOTO|nr:hypothetical protein AAT19DRAFT_10544 [Rhodotorula toruloides]
MRGACFTSLARPDCIRPTLPSCSHVSFSFTARLFAFPLPQHPMLALRLARPSAFRSLLPRLPSAPRLPRATFGTTTRFQPGYTWRMVKREVHEQDLEEAEDVSHLMTLEELDKTLDPAPYRSGAEVKSLKAGQPIELHPMLDDVNFFYIEPTHSSSPGARLEVRTEDCDIVVGNAYSDPAIDELATSPPCARLVVRMQGDLAADISNPEGVTVRDLLDGVGEYWERPVCDEAAKYLRRWLGDPECDNVVVVERHFQPENRYWAGWTRGPEVQEDGSVLLDCEQILRC